MDHRGLPTLRPGPGPVAPMGGDLYYYPSHMSGAASGASLGELARALWRHAWLIVLVVFAAAVLAIVVAYQLRPYYDADGAIVVGSRKGTIPELQPALVSPSGDLALVRSEVSVLKSRTLLREVARKLDLADDPEFNSRLRPEDDSLLARLDPRPHVKALIRQLLDKDDRSPANEAEIVAAEVERTLAKNLDILNDGRDYVIWLRYRSEDPRTSAAVVNTLMASYLEQYIASNVAATLEANATLRSRAEELKSDMDAAQNAAEAYASMAGVFETRLGSVSAQQLSDLNLQLSLARSERAAADQRYQQALSLQKRGSIDSAAPEVLASPLIQRLREQEATLSQQNADLSRRLGANHPNRRNVQTQLNDVRRTIKDEVGKVVVSLRAQADVARGRQGELEGKVKQLERAALGGADKQAKLERLKADAEGKRRIYNEFMLRVAQTAKADDQKGVDARIISNAVPPVEKSGPRIFLFVAVAGVVSVLASVAGVLLHSQVDRGYENLDQVRTSTGLPGLAAIPSVRGARRMRSGRYVLERPASTLAETMRGFRARLKASSPQEPPKTILVSSAEPGEGKSSFALNLARLSARDGRRVMLVEYDLRRPRLRRLMDIGDGPDLSQVLAGEVDWRDAIAIDRDSGMHFIVAPEMLGDRWSVLEANRLEQVLREASTHYDYIVVDSPPIMRVPDASLVSPYVDAVILAVEWKKTRRRLVAEAIRRLGVRDHQICGVVLTKADRSSVGYDLYKGYA